MQKITFSKPKRTFKKANNKVVLSKLNELENDVNLVLLDSMPKTKYKQRTDFEKKYIRHWGQRKLLLSEIYFLTKYGDKSFNVVYAGAAPGNFF